MADIEARNMDEEPPKLRHNMSMHKTSRYSAGEQPDEEMAEVPTTPPSLVTADERESSLDKEIFNPVFIPDCLCLPRDMMALRCALTKIQEGRAPRH